MRFDDGKASAKPSFPVTEPGRLKRDHDRQRQGQEGEFEYYDENENINDVSREQVGTSSGSRQMHIPITTCPFSVRQRPQIPTTPISPSDDHIDEAQEWASEYAATQAHQARQRQDDDADRMADAAADLLAQIMVDEDDEKLQNSKFVKYLRELASGRYPQVTRPTEQQVELERADFAEWRHQYEQSTAHLTTEEEREAWNAVIKDWNSYSAHGIGYEGFAERQFIYEFMYENGVENPFFESQNILEVADNLWRAGRLSQAILAYEAAVQQSPSDAAAWHRLGQLQVENEQDILAVAAFQRAIAAGIENDSIWLELAGCLLNEQCRAEAIQALIQFLRRRQTAVLPDERVDPTLLVDECLRCFATTLSAASESDVNLQIGLSLLYNMNGDPEESLKILETITDIPDDHMRRSVLNRRGALHANSGNYATALRLYDRVIAERPESVRSFYNRGVSLFNNGDYRAAIDSFATALSFQSTPTVGAMREDVRRGLAHVWDMLRLACEMADLPELTAAARQFDLSVFKS